MLDLQNIMFIFLGYPNRMLVLHVVMGMGENQY
jgi:hypothetical protein